MPKIAVITDSAANLSAKYLQNHPNLFVIPLIIVIDGKPYRDQVEISADEVYQKLDSSTITTSLPNLEDLDRLLEEIKLAGYTDLLSINISSGLSGTFNAFRLMYQNIKGIQITQYDSKSLAGGEGFVVEYALELIDKNKTISEIIPMLDQLRFHDSLAFYTINTLKYLKKGGRIGKVEGTIGDILHIKPVITVNDEGVYVTMSKAFGLQRSLISMKQMLKEKFGDELIDLTIHYGNDQTQAEDLAKKLLRELNVRHLTISQLTPVLGIHTGPEMIAYIARKVV